MQAIREGLSLAQGASAGFPNGELVNQMRMCESSADLFSWYQRGNAAVDSAKTWLGDAGAALSRGSGRFKLSE
jgi:hypothetical protein